MKKDIIRKVVTEMQPGYITQFTDTENYFSVTIMSNDFLASVKLAIDVDNPYAIYIRDLGVDSEYRDQGYGTKLLNLCFAIAKQIKGVSTCYITVPKGSWMYDWYCRLGFIYAGDESYGIAWMEKTIQKNIQRTTEENSNETFKEDMKHLHERMFYDILFEEMGMKINHSQNKILENIDDTKYTAIVKPRNSGVSTIVKAKLAYELLFGDNKNIRYSTICIGEAIEALSDVIRYVEIIKEKYGISPNLKRENNIIANRNGVTISFDTYKTMRNDFPADEIYLDEYAFAGNTFENPMLLSIKSSETKITFISTPNGVDNHFFDIIKDIKDGKSVVKLIDLSINGFIDSNYLKRMKQMPVKSIIEECFGKFDI